MTIELRTIFHESNNIQGCKVSKEEMEHKRGGIKGKILFKHRAVRITMIFMHRTIRITEIFKHRVVPLQGYTRIKLFKIQNCLYYAHESDAKLLLSHEGLLNSIRSALVNSCLEIMDMINWIQQSSSRYPLLDLGLEVMIKIISLI